MLILLKALSIDPINPHMLELLNMALESSASMHVPESSPEYLAAAQGIRDLLARNPKGKQRVLADGLADVTADEMSIG
jgi:anaphase-promoting complex subunit 6